MFFSTGLWYKGAPFFVKFWDRCDSEGGGTYWPFFVLYCFYYSWTKTSLGVGESFIRCHDTYFWWLERAATACCPLTSSSAKYKKKLNDNLYGDQHAWFYKTFFIIKFTSLVWWQPSWINLQAMVNCKGTRSFATSVSSTGHGKASINSGIRLGGR